jgi:hypothetical protein
LSPAGEEDKPHSKNQKTAHTYKEHSQNEVKVRRCHCIPPGQSSKIPQSLNPPIRQFLNYVTKPFPHPINQAVEDVVLTDAEQFAGRSVGTVKDQPHSSGVHGILDHIYQTTDFSGEAGANRQIEDLLGQLSKAW